MRKNKIDINHKLSVVLTAIFLVLLTTSCSTLNKVIYRPTIHQGNYLDYSTISKVHTGMLQKQIVYLLGNPVISDLFGTNTWFYVFYRQLDHERAIQKTLTLTFNAIGVLTNIDYKSVLIR